MRTMLSLGDVSPAGCWWLVGDQGFFSLIFLNEAKVLPFLLIKKKRVGS
jgi:hypothetical protein